MFTKKNSKQHICILENSRKMKNNPSSNFFKVMKYMFKLYLINCFYTSLLMIGFEDLILILYIWVTNLTTKVIMKIIYFKQHFATTYRRLTKKIMAFVYRSIFLVHFTMPAPTWKTSNIVGIKYKNCFNT